MVQSEPTKTRSARIHEMLGHPVVDGDGHVLEPLPLFADFVRDHGRSDLVAKASTFKAGAENFRMRREASAEERRRRGMYPAFWTAACGDTEYFATVTAPSRYADRLGDAGIDFSVLLPSIGLLIGGFAEDDERVTLCHLYNEFMAELYGPYRERFTVAAAIPMGNPEEAMAEMRHVKALGAKVALIPSYFRRQVQDEAGTGPWHGSFGSGGWLDTFGLDSAYDYDPVWATAIDLGLPLAAHSPGIGFSDRASVSNYMYNHAGHFAAAGEALAKSLFFGGVTYRFPRLRVALLEGTVAVGVRLYVDLLARWRKRGAHAIDRLNPANIDRERLGLLLTESDPRFAQYAPEQFVDVYGNAADRHDDFAAVGIASEEDLAARYCSNFFWGCEADDPLVGLAFDRRVMGSDARVRPMMGSDIGHWDVPEFDSPLAEAYELVEREVLDSDGFRQFVFANAVQFYGALNPEFFAGTSVEREASDELALTP
jgi:predicted TIM-barrel fold metal-dependent hydrolase